jgi:hypothetical protein
MAFLVKTAQEALEWLADNVDAIAEAKYEADEAECIKERHYHMVYHAAEGRANVKRTTALTDREYIINQEDFLNASWKWRKLYERRNYCQLLIKLETSQNFNRQMEHV